MTLIISQDSTDAFEVQIAALLVILGCPEGLVTDLATFLDFISMFEYPTRESAQERLDDLLIQNGIETHIEVTSTLVDACRKLLEENPNWPAPKTIH